MIFCGGSFILGGRVCRVGRKRGGGGGELMKVQG